MSLYPRQKSIVNIYSYMYAKGLNIPSYVQIYVVTQIFGQQCMFQDLPNF